MVEEKVGFCLARSWYYLCPEGKMKVAVASSKSGNLQEIFAFLADIFNSRYYASLIGGVLLYFSRKATNPNWIDDMI
jgi:hypothetical protein